MYPSLRPFVALCFQRSARCSVLHRVWAPNTADVHLSEAFAGLACCCVIYTRVTHVVAALISHCDVQMRDLHLHVHRRREHVYNALPLTASLLCVCLMVTVMLLNRCLCAPLSHMCANGTGRPTAASSSPMTPSSASPSQWLRPRRPRREAR